jgi:Holliday junction resolvasome RuvABC endonuclease subunit
MAVDPSLTCSGWALFSIQEGSLIAVGKIKSDPPKVALSLRMQRLQERVGSVLEKIGLGARDILVCEAPTTMKDPHNAIKVEQVRGLFESGARGRGATVPGRVNPRSVQYEVMGLKGKQVARAEVKQAAVRTALYLFAPRLQQLGLMPDEAELKRHQDIIDALLIGRLALIKVKSAREAGVTVESSFDTQAVQSRRSWRVRACGAP